KKCRQCGQLGWPELRTELNQHRPESGAECADPIEELIGEVGAVAQLVFVRNFLRHLEREREVSRSALGPTLHGAFRWNRIERRIDFDGVERASVHRKKISRACIGWIERSQPGIIVPALCSDPHRGRHDVRIAMRGTAVSRGARFGGLERRPSSTGTSDLWRTPSATLP